MLGDFCRARADKMHVLKIREIREAQRYSLEDVAQKIGMTRSNLSKIELEKATVSLAWLRVLARFFRVTVADLLSEEDHPFALSDTEKTLIQTYRQIGPAAKKQAIPMLLVLSGKDTE
jgi:transcriptional regulator with XRE-family HTH domain